MKTIGILGGMSAASTQIYYRTLCALTQERFGGLTNTDLPLFDTTRLHCEAALDAATR